MVRARRRQRGQALVELAISVPVLLWLLLGSFDASVMVSDKVIAGYATRQGARLAAEVGGGETHTSAPRAANGVFNPGTDLYSKFTGAGVFVSSNFPITAREQIPPNETSIGVKLIWVYRPPTGFASFSINLNEYTVMKTAPVLL